MSEIRQIQVDGINYDLVITEDEVAATRAEQAAAQSAASATQSQQYANSASGSAVTAYSYMEAAEDAADRAEAIVGGQFVSYGQTQSLTDAQKTLAKDNIGVTESGNKNLLDNWYFIDPVNSRGLSYYTDTNYTIDRWRFWEAGSSLTLTSNGVVFANSGTINGLFQYLEPKRFQSLYGKTITISAIIDGTLYSQTGTASNNCDITCGISGNTYFKYYCNGSDGHFRLNVEDGSSITIKAAKLEIGSISTLEKDAAPNKGEELTKCISVVSLYGDTCTNTGYGRTNPNLLDNWYFVGGGSQSGAEAFPINSRGKTYYEEMGYYFDRWKSDSPWSSPVKCGFQSEGVVLAGDVTPAYPTAYTQLSQVVANPPVGKTVTLSILTDNVSPDNEDSPPFLLTNGSVWTPITVGLTTVTFVWGSGVTSISIILPDGATSAASLRMQAIKLEVGTVSTLVNDTPPDYGEELTRCIYSKADQSDSYANSGFGRTNPNLLDNWYFVGGGSQLGDGVFPINQRGLTSYSANAYGIDRWICYGGAITLAADGVSVPANGVMTQPTANLTQLNGKTMTLSILYDSGMETGTAVLDLSGNTMFINNGASGQAYVTSAGLVQFYKGSAYKVKAAKLELGTVSTLPNDAPPVFSEELAKCQHYLWVDTFSANTVVANGVTFNTSSVFDLVAPVPMRKGTLSINFSVTPYITYGTGMLALAGGSSASIPYNNNGNHIRFQIGHQNDYDLGNLTEAHLLCGTETTMTVANEP